ncbi:uncharacterized protein FA14DRAFT_29455 [Meira miltonrushii]|uniref:Uncharacterized protein n=1 Tax=Meira miltonrushii TaxID=1280837 RepID=A0A316V127_9BASI|nr:uncharacterized protein FA14DRAFT_29455 [Meira miltonrushii]PWN31257.1 hypothetical protein FA14DRAFT_29455 [Meira miltonrushii]
MPSSEPSHSYPPVEVEEEEPATKAMPGYLGGAYNGVCNVVNGALDRYLGTGEPTSSSSTSVVEPSIKEGEVQKNETVEQDSVTKDDSKNGKDAEPETIVKEEESAKVEEAKVQSTAEKAVDDVKQMAHQSYQSAGKTFDGVKQRAFEAYEKLTSSSKKQVNDGVQKIKDAAGASQKAIKRASLRPEKKKSDA